MFNIMLHLKDVGFIFLSLFIYFDRERENAKIGKGQRERERESQAGSVLSARTPNAGLKHMNCEIITWAKIMT